MTKEATFEQLRLAMELKEGDKIKLNSGEIVEFVRTKQKKFVGIMNGALYNISIASINSVVEKADQNKKKEESLNLIGQLQKGDWFYINKNGNALAFKFDKIEGKKIIATNPIRNAVTRIDINFQIGLIK